jgi:transposase
VVDAQGRVLLTRCFSLTRAALEVFARTTLQPPDRVALEATTNCWAVADVLRPLVAQVTVSNPLATKAIASAKVKTDKVDAHVLAQLLRCGYLPEVWTPDAATQQLRQLTGRRAALVRQRTALQNRIHSVLAMRLIPVPVERLFSLAGTRWLSSLLQGDELDPEGQLLIDGDLTLLAGVQREIDHLDQALAARGWRDARVKLLMTLPGVDVTTAEALLAALGDIDRFPSPAQAAAYLGLVPSTRQSAQKCYHGPITKRGNNQARWMLIQAAQAVARHPGPLGHFFRRLKQKKNEEPQRGGRRRGPQAGDHRLAHAHPSRAVPLRAAALHGDETRGAARRRHRAEAPHRPTEGRAVRGETPRRLAHDQVARPGLRRRGAPPAAPRRAAHAARRRHGPVRADTGP